jgi:hypothetical protein
MVALISKGEVREDNLSEMHARRAAVGTAVYREELSGCTRRRE